MAQYGSYGDIKIGASVVGPVAVIDLTYGGNPALCPPPKVRFAESVEVVEMADHSIKQLGNPTIIWEIGSPPINARRALRALITAGLSEDLFIASPDGDGEVQNWACTMHWPNDASGYLSFRFIDDLVLTFKNCVEQ